MITADTITDEQIHALHRAGAIRARTAAAALGISYPTHADRKPLPDFVRACRETCAAIHNDRELSAEFAEEFCACGHRVSSCDGSRSGCAGVRP